MNTVNSTPKGSTVKMTFNIPTALKKRLKYFCLEYDRTMTDTIVAVLDSYLKKQESKEPVRYEGTIRRGRIR